MYELLKVRLTKVTLARTHISGTRSPFPCAADESSIEELLVRSEKVWGLYDHPVQSLISSESYGRCLLSVMSLTIRGHSCTYDVIFKRSMNLNNEMKYKHAGKQALPYTLCNLNVAIQMQTSCCNAPLTSLNLGIREAATQYNARCQQVNKVARDKTRLWCKNKSYMSEFKSTCWYKDQGVH